MKKFSTFNFSTLFKILKNFRCDCSLQELGTDVSSTHRLAGRQSKRSICILLINTVQQRVSLKSRLKYNLAKLTIICQNIRHNHRNRLHVGLLQGKDYLVINAS